MALATLESISSCSGRCSKPEKAWAKGPLAPRRSTILFSSSVPRLLSIRRFSGRDKRLEIVSKSKPVSPTADGANTALVSFSSPFNKGAIAHRLRVAKPIM